MRVGFVSEGRLQEFVAPWEEVDLLLFGFNGMEEVSYEKELKGETDHFAKAARLSKKQQAVVISGCNTDARGVKRKSAVVAENGKLLGVSDMLHAVDGKCVSGAELKIYPTSVGKIGVVVAEDICFFETVKALTLCGCDFLVCPFSRVEGEQAGVLLRASAYYFGVPVFLCGEGYAMLADPSGELVFASPSSPAQIEYFPKKEYHLVERRIRGFCGG